MNTEQWKKHLREREKLMQAESEMIHKRHQDLLNAITHSEWFREKLLYDIISFEKEELLCYDEKTSYIDMDTAKEGNEIYLKLYKKFEQPVTISLSNDVLEHILFNFELTQIYWIVFGYWCEMLSDEQIKFYSVSTFDFCNMEKIVRKFLNNSSLDDIKKEFRN
jgi:hypothetical protein